MLSLLLQRNVARLLKECCDGLQIGFLCAVDAPEIQQARFSQLVDAIGIDAEDGPGLLCAQKFNRCSVHGFSFLPVWLPVTTYITLKGRKVKRSYRSVYTVSTIKGQNCAEWQQVCQDHLWIQRVPGIIAGSGHS